MELPDLLGSISDDIYYQQFIHCTADNIPYTSAFAKSLHVMLHRQFMKTLSLENLALYNIPYETTAKLQIEMPGFLQMTLKLNSKSFL